MNSNSEKKVIIVGGGLGGLSAAIHLRVGGFEVVIYEANKTIGGRSNILERDGFRFDTGPSLLNYPWVFEQLFAAAGRKLQDYVTLLPVDPSITFRWANGVHLSLSSDLRHFLAECERLEPDSSAAVFDFLRDADAKYRIAFDKLVSRNVDSPLRWISSLNTSELRRTGIWRTFDGELRRFFKSRHLREALGSYAMYLGGSPFDLPGMFTILPYGEMAYGLWLPRGGIYGLVQGLENLALELGVEINTGSRVRKILTKAGRVSGVELEGGTTHAANYVVSNVDVPTTDTQLVDCDESRSKVLTKRARRTRMTPSVVTFYWGARGKVPGLGHHTIFLPENYGVAFDELFKHKRVPYDLPFYVSVPSATDPALAPTGDTTIFVLAPVPRLSEMPDADWHEEAQKIKAQIMLRLGRHHIELSEAQIAVEEIFTPVDWERNFGLYDGSAFGAAHTLRQIGPFRSKNFSSEISGLYYAGASTTPGTGMPMVVLSGQLVAERITNSVH